MIMPANIRKSDKVSNFRLALVVPNFRWCETDNRFLWDFIPYNLCLLAAVVQGSCDIRIIDAYHEDMDQNAFAAAIKEFSPHVVGITVLMDQCAPAGHLSAQIVKEMDEGITVVMGGVYATVNPDLAIADDNVDYVVVGEGEYVLRDLLDYLRGVGSVPKKGIVFKENNKVVVAPRANYIKDLDSLPLPAYDLIDLPSYINKAERNSVDAPSLFPYARILTSRGCPYGCSFCQVEIISGSKFRPRSAENILNEIRWLKNQYGIQSLVFDDDNLFTNRKRAVSILQGMIDHGLAMPWKSIATAVFRLDAELLELMKASGCEYIDVAIESGTQRVLKDIIGKPVNLEHAKKIVALAKKIGIFITANFIIGFPTETWEEIRQTIQVAQEIDADYTKIFGAIPLRHTRLWQLCEETNSFKKNFSISGMSWYAGQIETDEFTSDDLTILRAYEWDRLNFSTVEKREKIKIMMHIDDAEMHRMRQETRKKVINQIRKTT